jgi:hypothetical protein
MGWGLMSGHCAGGAFSARRVDDAAGPICGERKKFQARPGRVERTVAGAGITLRGIVFGRGLAAGIRGYTLAVYPRRCADRRLPVATYLREYRDRPRGCAAYPQEYGDRLRRLAIHRQKSGDTPWVAVDCDVGLSRAADHRHDQRRRP